MDMMKTDVIMLKKLMVENHFDSIGSLAKASGIHRNTLGKVLSGAIQPSADVMTKLVQALNISPEIAGTIFFSADLRTA